jgi:hypothetical protein
MIKKSMIVCLAAIAALFVSTHAYAAGVPFVYNTGEDIFVAGDGSLPAPFDKEPELAGAQSGYRCDIFGFFWAYVSISDCKPVAFKGDTYWDDAELASAVAKAHPEDTMSPGFWKKHGKFPLGVLLLGALGFGGWKKFKGGA